MYVHKSILYPYIPLGRFCQCLDTLAIYGFNDVLCVYIYVCMYVRILCVYVYMDRVCAYVCICVDRLVYACAFDRENISFCICSSQDTGTIRQVPTSTQVHKSFLSVKYK